jgi:Carboxypeptidase regulatory-like domain
MCLFHQWKINFQLNLVQVLEDMFMSNRMLLSRLFSHLTVSLLTIILTSSAFGQNGSSSVRGTITDSQGKAIPGATVILVSQQNTRRSGTTSDEGVYTFTQVQPGNYTIEVEAKNFKKSIVSNVKASVDAPTEVNVTVEVGGVSESVNVSANSIDNIVNTTTAALGTGFQAQQIENLPLQGRNVGALLSLQAAVTPDGSVAGGRSDQANITLDGVDVNDQQNGTAFTPVLRVNPDSIEEFRVTTTNADASQGRSSGAQISLVTKSGTNSFKGALYEYHRNTVTTANDYFNNAAGVKRPALLRNLFGGRLGGPIMKDKLFFFYNYEGLREAKGVSVVRTVPLASLGAGNIRFRDNAGAVRTISETQINAFLSGALPVVDVNPLARNLFASAASRYVSNDSTTGDGLNTGGFRFNAPLPVKQNTHTARLDWKITNDEKHTLFFRGNYQHDLTSGSPRFKDTPGTNTWSHPLGFVVGHSWIINNSMVNTFKYGLTRDAFSNQGDSNENAITFRDVFSPVNFSRTFARVTPVQNITNDFSWVKGNHTLQFGASARIIRNRRTSFGAVFDSGITNLSFYQGSGSVVRTPINQFLRSLDPACTAAPTGPGCAIASSFNTPAGAALSALFGRLSQYAANFNFGLDGSPLAAGKGIERVWASEEYDGYVQDIWKARSNLTITGGLRYGISQPVYEQNGFQAKPNVSLQSYFEQRIAAANNGQNYSVPITVVKAGKANNAPGFYSLDKNNFQPRVSVAWTPSFDKGFLSKIFGSNQESVFRGGFSMTNDYFGQALAVNFDGNNQLGFSSATSISANSYNVFELSPGCVVGQCRPAPLYTGSGTVIRTLPGITVPGNLTFPQLQPSDDARRIQGSLDSNLVSPVNYSWNLSYGRKFAGGLYVEGSYIARLARNLLAARDVVTPSNLRDPISGQTWYQAAGILEQLRRNGASVSQVPNLPFFNNIYSGLDLGVLLGVGTGLTNSQAAYTYALGNGTDWSFLQDQLDELTPKKLFYQRQYGALSAYGTIGSSDYHAATFSIRQRRSGLSWDLNYTFSKGIDDASGLQTSGVYGSALILNPLRQRDNRAVSDFDLRHIINANALWEVPIGKGKTYFSGMNRIADAFLGGWQMTGIFRYNTGYVANDYFDGAGWATNWNVRSNGVRVKAIKSSPNANSGKATNGGSTPNQFTDPVAAYKSFRSPGPGETGDRNQFRDPSYIVLDGAS